MAATKILQRSPNACKWANYFPNHAVLTWTIKTEK